MSTTTTTAPRIAWLDYAKAIGITLVVLGHVISGIGQTPGLVISEPYKLLNAFIYSFHMPLFFALAGYVVQLRPAATTGAVLRETFWSLVVPYFVWSTLWIGMKVALSDYTDNPVTLGRLQSILWEPIGHMWFLYQLFLIRLCWYAIERLLPMRGRLLVLALAAAASLAFAVHDIDELTPWFFLQNFAFFGIGLLVLPRLARSLSGYGLVLLASAAIAAWGAVFLASGVLGAPATGPLLALTGMLAVVLLTQALPNPDSCPLRLFAYLGEASLAIYVMHLFVTTASRKALAAAGLMSEATVLLVATPLGILVPALAYLCVLRLSGLTGVPLTRYIGLGQARQSRYLPARASDQSSPPLVAMARPGG